MRFIGNKENLVETIYLTLKDRQIQGKTFGDFFSGTSNVGRFFKKKGYQVFSSDLLYFSYVLQRAYLVNNQEPTFEGILAQHSLPQNSLFSTPLTNVINYLNHIEGKEGFIYKNYTPEGTQLLAQPRMFFTAENAKKIDSIRQQIEDWRTQNLLTEDEYFVLLACLIESVPFYANISGVYAAFQKNWDARALKPFRLREIEIIESSHTHTAFNSNSVDVLEKFQTDLLYLDPPYNHRQYAPNYHILETIARYDNPEIKGVAGLRNYDNQKSLFCNAQTGIQELDRIARTGNFKYLILSYNSEGVMPQERIRETLEKYGSVELIEFDYLRFKSNNNGDAKHKKFIKEQLYLLANSNNPASF